jgi:hypothetical protein
MLRAGAVALRGDKASATRLLEDAEQSFTLADMRLHAEIARRARGLHAAEPALVAAADEWLAAARVKNPARFTALLAPVFVDGA